MRIAIVGPCAAGKTTLARNLRALGFDAEECAQEHSEVQTMWQRIAQPDLLIHLDASLETVRARLDVDWEPDYIERMNLRLSHARALAQFSLTTDSLSEQEVCARVVEFLRSRGVHPQ